MNMKKVLAVVSGFALMLTMALPGALAESTDSEPVTAEASNHTETCSEDCTDAECSCGCHLFNRVMGCETLDDLWTMIEAVTDEEWSVLTEEENAQIDAKITAMEPAPEPEVVLVQEDVEETVPSEIESQTVDYTNVAPFGAPVIGGQE